MATDESFIRYVVDQIETNAAITYKKMFGEYMIYVNKKPVIIVCDNTAYVKMLDCIKSYFINGETGFPYQGAKEHYILDIDNGEALKEIIREVEKATPMPKKKKSR